MNYSVIVIIVIWYTLALYPHSCEDPYGTEGESLSYTVVMDPMGYGRRAEKIDKIKIKDIINLILLLY